MVYEEIDLPSVTGWIETNKGDLFKIYKRKVNESFILAIKFKGEKNICIQCDLDYAVEKFLEKDDEENDR